MTKTDGCDAMAGPEPPEQVQRLFTAWGDEICAALALLTRFPVSIRGPMPDDLNGRAMLWYPVAGILVGLCVAAAYLVAYLFGLPEVLAALIAVVVAVVVTGGLHEDGLADVLDGFGGGLNREDKLTIMRDSRVGNFGVLALLLSVGLRAGALAGLATPGAVGYGYIAAAALSRAAMVPVVWLIPSARHDGLGAGVGRPSLQRTVGAVLLGAVIAWLCVGWVALAAMLVAGLATAGVAALAHQQIGGYTGDVLGTVQQVVEIVVLVMLVAWL